MGNKAAFQRLFSLVGLIIVFAIIIAVNGVFSYFKVFRVDATDEKLFTLSQNSKNILGSMERKVTLKYYFSRSSKEIPNSFKPYGTRIHDLLKEYKAHASGHVILESYDPKLFSDAEEWAQKYGLAGQMTGLNSDAFYLGLVATCGAKEAAIPFISPQVEPQLEYLISRLITEVSTREKGKLGLVSSLPVTGGMPQNPMMMGQQGQAQWTFISQLEQQYEIEELSGEQEEIAEDIQALLLIHPKNLSEKTLYAIDQFVMRGGKLLAAVDPMALSDQSAGGQNQFAMFQNGSDLNRLTEAWGLSLEAAQVVGDNKRALMVSGGQGGQAQRNISFIGLQKDEIASEDTATQGLENIMLPFAGSFKLSKKEGLNYLNLLSSSDDAGKVPSFQAMGGASNAMKGLIPAKNLPIAVRMTGNFKTAFPDGFDSGSTSENSEVERENSKESNEKSLQESNGQGVVVLIADVDFLNDQFSVRRQRIFGQSIVAPMNDNLSLIVNLCEQLMGNEELIGLRSRGTFNRPFDRVAELEANAQRKWMSKAQDIQKRIDEAQQRINELQSNKSEGQKLFLNKEQQRELVSVREAHLSARKELKNVQKNLRQDIDKLGLQLKWLNMGLWPLFIGVLGITRVVLRSKNN